MRKIECNTPVHQQWTKGQSLLHMYVRSDLYMLLPFSWYSWRFNCIH